MFFCMYLTVNSNVQPYIHEEINMGAFCMYVFLFCMGAYKHTDCSNPNGATCRWFKAIVVSFLSSLFCF